MRYFNNRIFIIFAEILIIFLFGSKCQSAEITISAAASLSNAFDEIKKVFMEKNPDITVNTNYAASNPLLRQILAGAPVDIFASADQETMDKAMDTKAINAQTRRNFVINELVLIRPKENKSQNYAKDLGNALELANEIAIGDPSSVPAGRYAKEALTNYGLWEKLKDKFISCASVRQVLDYVSRGEAEAGFVYTTDALQGRDKVEIVMTVEGHKPVSYPIAITASSPNTQIAKKFIDFVLSEEGEDILKSFGFKLPD